MWTVAGIPDGDKTLKDSFVHTKIDPKANLEKRQTIIDLWKRLFLLGTLRGRLGPGQRRWEKLSVALKRGWMDKAHEEYGQWSALWWEHWSAGDH